MAYTVDKGIPCPARPSGPNPNKYPFAQMEVGDSFNCPLSERASVSVLMRRYGAATGTKFTSRKDSTTQTVRVWRVC